MEDIPASHHHQENGIQEANQAHGSNPPPNPPPPPQGRRLRARGPRPSYRDSEEQAPPQAEDQSQAPPQAEDQSESSSVNGKGKRKRGRNEDGTEKDRPFGCDQKGCDTACGQLVNLNRHRTSRHGIKKKLTADDWKEWKKNSNNNDNENAETAAPSTESAAPSIHALKKRKKDNNNNNNNNDEDDDAGDADGDDETANPSNQSSTPASTSTINKEKEPLTSALDQPLTPKALSAAKTITGLLGGDAWKTQQRNGETLICSHGANFLQAVSRAVRAATASSGGEIKDGELSENLCEVLEDLRGKSKEGKFSEKHFVEATKILNGRAVQKKKSSVALGQSSTPSTSALDQSLTSRAISVAKTIAKLLGGDAWQTQQWNGRLLVSFQGVGCLYSVWRAIKAAIASSGEEIKDGELPENLCEVLEDLRVKSKEGKFSKKHFDEATEILNGRASALDGSSTPASIPAVQKKKSSVALGQSSTPSTSALDQPLSPQAVVAAKTITKLLGGDAWKTQQHNGRALICFRGHPFLKTVSRAVRAATASSSDKVEGGEFTENLCEVLEDLRVKSKEGMFSEKHFVEATKILDGRASHSYQRCQRCREKNLSCKGSKDGCKSCMAAGANCQFDVRPKQCPSLKPPLLLMEPFKETSTAYKDRLKAVLESSRKEVEKKKEENETRNNGNVSGSNLTSTVYNPDDKIPMSHSSYRKQGTEACNSCGFPCCPNGLSLATEDNWLQHSLIYHSYLKLLRCFCGFTSSVPYHFGGGRNSHKCQTKLKGKELEMARKESKLEREQVWEILNSIITDRVNCGLTSLPSNLLEDTKFWGISRWSPSVATASTPASSISPSPNAASSSSISPTANITSSSNNASQTASAPSSSINRTASTYSSSSANASPNVTSPSTNAIPNTTTTTTSSSSTKPTANASSSSTKPTANAPSTNPTAKASSSSSTNPSPKASSSSTNPSPKVASPPTKNPNPIHFAASNRNATTTRPIKRIAPTPAMADRLPGIMKTYKLQTEDLEKKKNATTRVEAPRVICQNCQRNPNRKELSVKWEESNGSKGEPSSFGSVGTLERGQRAGKERSANGGKSTKGSRASKKGKGKEKARDPCDDCQSDSDQPEDQYMSKD